VFEKAKALRDKMHLLRDDGEHFYVEFFNQKEWCRNQYQVSQPGDDGPAATKTATMLPCS
jgi:hypothetical protein